ncbi:hypothetical protein [Magnetospirillum gryphiswaldense]|nr:hypothetical protein [Magnetospirillum gryphiswaldense]
MTGLAVVGLVLAWGPARAQSCPPMPKPTYGLQLDHGSPVYRNDRSRAEVSRLAGPGLPGHSQQGLTHSETEFSLTITVNAAVLESGRTCVALGEARGVWRLSKLEVDIVREHPPGTCPHAVIRAHEDQHVAMAQRMFIRHAGTIRARLGQLVAQSRPSITALAPAQATQVLRDQLMEGLKTTLAAFERDLARANAAIDTPQNYKAETAKCPRWE